MPQGVEPDFPEAGTFEQRKEVPLAPVIRIKWCSLSGWKTYPGRAAGTSLGRRPVSRVCVASHPRLVWTARSLVW